MDDLVQDTKARILEKKALRIRGWHINVPENYIFYKFVFI